jgi:fido (protein-threonine AMPylation protein)
LKKETKIIFTERLAYYFNYVNATHPFREGNDRHKKLKPEILVGSILFHHLWDNY